MGDDLTLYEITGSPNNVKARVALGYKGLEYERKPFEIDTYPGDRSRIVKLSRQPRMPVLQHGKTVIFDSGAIMRYLEANFPDTPRLFRDDHAEHGEIEQWEIYSRTRIGEPIGALFGQAFTGGSDAGVIAKANEQFHERTGAFEDRLSTNDFLVGDHLTAADVACASPLYLADLTEEVANTGPIARFFHDNLHFGDDREKTRAWARRVLSYDPVVGRGRKA